MIHDTRTAEQIARERAELEAADREEPQPRRRLRAVEDLEPFDPHAALERLRAKATTSTEPADPASIEAARIARRRRRLETAGIRDRDCLDVLAAAPEGGIVSKDRPPPVAPGHDGNRALWKAAVGFARNRTIRTLLLAGTTGTGKSWCAAWLCAEQDGALWVPGTRIEPCEEWTRLRRNLVACPLVVFPDLTTRTTTWQGGQVADLVEQRHDEGRRTVVVTNLDGDALGRLLGDAAMDRIRSTRGMTANATGESLRGRP